jgi:hypothetical protein
MDRRTVAMAVFSVWAVSVAHANPVYRCQGSNGTYVSDKPCQSGSLGVIGPTQAPAYAPYSTSNRLPTAQKAPDYLQYLSPTCASLNDGLRTASSRGVGYQTQAELRSEYQTKCGEEDAAARRRDYEDKLAQREEQRTQVAQDRARRQEAAMSREQCAEMLRILRERRKRFDTMTAGERADVERFEANYHERCGR